MKILNNLPFKKGTLNHVINLASGVLLFLFTTKHYGWSDYAQLSTFLALQFIGSQIFNFSIALRIAILTSRGQIKRAKKLYWIFMRIAISLSTLLFFTFPKNSQLLKFILLLVLTCLIGASNKNSNYIIAGTTNFIKLIYISIIKMTILGVILLIATSGSELDLIYKAFLLMELSSFIISAYFVHKIDKPEKVQDLALSESFSISFLFALTAFIQEFASKVDFLIVYIVCSKVEAGYYALISNAYEALLGLFANSKMQTFALNAAENHLQSHTKIQKQRIYYFCFVNFCILTLIPLTLFVVTQRGVPVKIVFVPMVLMLFSVNLVIDSSIGSLKFLQLNRYSDHLLFILAPLLLNITSVLVLGRLYGLTGAALSVLLSNALQSFIYLKKIGIKPKLGIWNQC
jgi:hypothetical protein